MKKQQTRTTLRLDNDVIGFLHYYVREGIAPSINEVVNTIIFNFTKAYAKTSNKDLESIKKEARFLYDATRIPTHGSDKKQDEIYKAMTRLQKEDQ